MITEQIEQPEISQKSIWILTAVCILGIMIQIDFTAVNVALIAIGRSIHADLNTVQWALSAYILAWGALVLTAGRCADLFGKRRMFLIGTLLFMLGSGFTGTATVAWFLILGRVIQGIGGALFLPSLYTLIFTNFPENKRGFAMGILTAAISVGLAIGPTFGGVVMHILNWRWIFFLNIPLGIPVIAIILLAVKREPWRLLEEPMDYVGAFLVALSLVILMYALNQVNLWGVYSTQFIFSLVCSVILALIFVFFESRIAYPLIQLAMFRKPIFLGCVLAYVVIGFSFSTILIVGGLYLENALDYSALHTGFIFLIMTAMFAIVSVLGGKIADRTDPQTPIIISGMVMAAAFFTFALCNQHSPLWMPMLALGLYGVGCGLGFPALNTTMLKSVPSSMMSTASSAFAMFGCIGNAVGLILSSVIIITFAKRHLAQIIPSLHLAPDQAEKLRIIIAGTHYSAKQLTGFRSEDIPNLLDLLRSAFIHGMRVSMILAVILSLLTIVIGATLIKKPAN